MPGSRFLLAIMTFTHVHFAWAAKPLAPSWGRALCERVLIATGLWNPSTRALVVDSAPPTVLDSRAYLVTVKHSSSESWVTFSRTDRDFFDFLESRYYPRNYLNYESYQGKTVLDLACGDGRLVETMRRQGIDAIGLDAHLRPYQKAKPYFVLAGAHATGLAAERFDVIFSTQGPITYHPDDEKLLRAIFKEIHRLLKPGGRLLVSPVEKRVANYLPQGLRIVAQPNADWMAMPSENNDFKKSNYWLEIEKFAD